MAKTSKSKTSFFNSELLFKWKVSVKVPLEGDPLSHHTIIGTFWFRKARFYFENAEHMVQANDRINNEFYIDHCMNYLIKASLNVHVFEVDQYISYGTPNDLLTYNYWQAYFNESRTHVWLAGFVDCRTLF